MSLESFSSYLGRTVKRVTIAVCNEMCNALKINHNTLALHSHTCNPLPMWCIFVPVWTDVSSNVVWVSGVLASLISTISWGMTAATQ